VRIGLVDVDGVDGLARLRVVAVDHLDGLATQVLAENRVFAVAKRRFVNIEFVGIDGALHDGLAEAVGGSYEHSVPKPGFRIQREDHAGGAEIAAHHRLYAR
jgi:hypothetical protein